MRLVDLEPQWLHAADGTRIGFAFLCPTRLGGPRKEWQTCFFQPTPRRLQIEAVQRAAFADDPDADGWRANVQLCKPEQGWSLPSGTNPAAATFEAMTVTPSLDGSAGGNWHGFITNGAIVGGIP